MLFQIRNSSLTYLLFTSTDPFTRIVLELRLLLSLHSSERPHWSTNWSIINYGKLSFTWTSTNSSCRFDQLIGFNADEATSVVVELVPFIPPTDQEIENGFSLDYIRKIVSEGYCLSTTPLSAGLCTEYVISLYALDSTNDDEERARRFTKFAGKNIWITPQAKNPSIFVTMFGSYSLFMSQILHVNCTTTTERKIVHTRYNKISQLQRLFRRFSQFF